MSRVWKLGLLAIAVTMVLGFTASLFFDSRSAIELGPTVTRQVTRGDMLVTITEEGTLESSKNTEIKCEIRGGYGGRGGMSTVTSVIPAGSVVEKGDVLVRLDTKIIEETISLGKTDTNIAKADLARAEADLAKAKVAIDAYLKGTYRSQMKELEKQMAIAQRNLLISQTMLRKSDSLFRQGYVTELDVDVSGYTATQAELEVKVKETEMDVLSRLTKAMRLETLNGELKSTRARLEGRKAGLALEQSRLDLALEELERCVIRAPQSGLVIYPSTAKWKDSPDITEGASVHNNQVLLLMPDLSQMQIKVAIHESMIDRIKPGLPARVKLPDRTLNTEVSSVAEVAQPAGWWTGNVVKYDTIIMLPSQESLRPGMTAEVEIVMAHHENILSIPVAAVLETDAGSFCWVETTALPERRSVQLGDSNDEFIIVEDGLQEGDEVVLNPLTCVAEARQMVSDARVHTVKRGDLVVTLTEQGSLESYNNTQVKCKVRGASTINWVIENGSQVAPGDELVRLENKQIEEYLHERTKFAYL